MNAWWWVVVLGVSTACGSVAGASESPVRTSMVDMPPSYRFEPKVIEVPVGTTVTWHNSDNFTHSVQVGGGEVLHAEPGASVSQRFDRPGTYEYVCTFHPHNMRGTVIVTAQ